MVLAGNIQEVGPKFTSYRYHRFQITPEIRWLGRGRGCAFVKVRCYSTYISWLCGFISKVI